MRYGICNVKALLDSYRKDIVDEDRILKSVGMSLEEYAIVSVASLLIKEMSEEELGNYLNNDSKLLEVFRNFIISDNQKKSPVQDILKK